MSKPGARSKLTPEVQERICATLRAAGTLEDAALTCNVSVSSVMAWMARGRTEGNGRYLEFLEAVKKARAQRRLALEATIRKRSTEEWQAAAWLLERTEPKRYALRVRVQVEEELASALSRLEARLPAKAYERVLVALTDDVADAPDTPDTPDTTDETPGLQ